MSTDSTNPISAIVHGNDATYQKIQNLSRKQREQVVDGLRTCMTSNNHNPDTEIQDLLNRITPDPSESSTAGKQELSLLERFLNWFHFRCSINQVARACMEYDTMLQDINNVDNKTVTVDKITIKTEWGDITKGTQIDVVVNAANKNLSR